MISRKKALQLIRQKDARSRFLPFSIEFVNQETGEISKYNHVTLPQRERVELEQKQRAEDKKGPNPYLGKTNLTFCKGEMIRQCHIYLITRVNGEQVI